MAFSGEGGVYVWDMCHTTANCGVTAFLTDFYSGSVLETELKVYGSNLVVAVVFVFSDL